MTALRPDHSHHPGPDIPPPPPALAERLRATLGQAAASGASGAPLVMDDLAGISPEAYLEAADRLLRALVRDGCASRETALDLLTVDALVTYAFEAASREPARLDTRAREAMARISALAAEIGA